MNDADSFLGCVEGFKVLNWFEPRGCLQSPLQRELWPSRHMVAKCECLHSHRPGSTEGSCGIYACHDVRNALQYWESWKSPVMAYVRGYGMVTEGDQAWRAENAEIVALYGKSNVLYKVVLAVAWLMFGFLTFSATLSLLEGDSLATVLWSIFFAVMAGVGLRGIVVEHGKFAPVLKGVPYFHSARKFAKAVGHPEIEGELRNVK